MISEREVLTLSIGQQMQVRPGEARAWNFPSLSITPTSALGTHWKQQAMSLSGMNTTVEQKLHFDAIFKKTQ